MESLQETHFTQSAVISGGRKKKENKQKNNTAKNYKKPIPCIILKFAQNTPCGYVFLSL